MGLRPTFVYERSFTTEACGEELLRLTAVSRWRGLAAVAFDWAVIAGAILAATRLGHPLAWLAAIAIVGARQHALLILMHDAAHFRLVPNQRWNERLSDWLCAYPHGVATAAYRHDHLLHHFFVNTEKDPNWVPKRGQPDWAMPKSGWALARLFLKDLLGGGLLRIAGFILYYYGGQRARARAAAASRLRTARSRESRGSEDGEAPAAAPVSPPAPARPLRRRGTGLAQRLAYYAIAAAVITACGVWPEVLLLWVLPLFTVVPALLRLRVLAEHYGLERKTDMDHSRNYRPNPLERFLFAPHNVWYHLDHHLFPAIPFYNLPAAHALLERVPDYRRTAHQNGALFLPATGSVLADLTGDAPRVPAWVAAAEEAGLDSRESWVE